MPLFKVILTNVDKARFENGRMGTEVWKPVTGNNSLIADVNAAN